MTRSWKVIDKLQNDKVIETHGRWEAAYRAMMILTAHELKNGRKAHYATPLTRRWFKRQRPLSTS